MAKYYITEDGGCIKILMLLSPDIWRQSLSCIQYVFASFKLIVNEITTNKLLLVCLAALVLVLLALVFLIAAALGS